jgi:phosphatidylserine synthase
MFFSLKDLSKLQILSNYQYVVDRNINYEVDTKFAANLPYYISYLINLFNNSVVYAVRAQLFDLEYRLYFHGIGIWQFAVVLTSAFFFWIKILKNQYFRKNKIFHIGLIIILSYLFLSTSTYPQVRYMMPFIFWLVVPIFLYLDLRDVILLFYLFLIIAIFIIFLGLSHKPGTGIDIDNFSKNLFIN